MTLGSNKLTLEQPIKIERTPNPMKFWHIVAYCLASYFVIVVGWPFYIALPVLFTLVCLYVKLTEDKQNKDDE